MKTVPWSDTVAAPLPLRLASLLHLTALVVLLAAGGLVPASLRAAPAAPEPSGTERSLSIPLQCRLGKGTGQPCRMEVMAVGAMAMVVAATVMAVAAMVVAEGAMEVVERAAETAAAASRVAEGNVYEGYANEGYAYVEYGDDGDDGYVGYGHAP